MCADTQLVIVLDDDPSVLASLGRLLTAHGYPTRLHQHAEDLYHDGPPVVPACLLLDQQLAGSRTGTEVHAELLRRGWDLPVIFLTAHWNVQLVVDVMRAGADGFLTKPYEPAELMHEVDRALGVAREKLDVTRQLAEFRARVAALTPRERSIVARVAAGALNKEIADHLGVALPTVKLHRARAMRKLGAGNAAELARLAELAGLTRND